MLWAEIVGLIVGRGDSAAAQAAEANRARGSLRRQTEEEEEQPFHISFTTALTTTELQFAYVHTDPARGNDGRDRTGAERERARARCGAVRIETEPAQQMRASWFR